MIFKINFLILIVNIFFLGCSTGPDLERNNPHDIDPNSANYDSLKYPPSTENYQFTGNGLVIKSPIRAPLNDVRIWKKNGSNNFVFFLKTSKQKNQYLDKEINKRQDIGFPLEYLIQRFGNGELVNSNLIKINFGKISHLDVQKTNDTILVTWESNIYLNDGFIINQKYNDERSITIFNLSYSENRFEILNSNENINSTYSIIPFKYFQGQKTYLDTTYVNPTQF